MTVFGPAAIETSQMGLGFCSRLVIRLHIMQHSFIWYLLLYSTPTYIAKNVNRFHLLNTLTIYYGFTYLQRQVFPL